MKKSKSTVESFQLPIKTNEMLHEREMKLQEKRYEQKKLELDNCTFRPNLSLSQGSGSIKAKKNNKPFQYQSMSNPPTWLKTSSNTGLTSEIFESIPEDTR